jgi:transcriptional regulator with XRE-family HTH domain
VKTIRALRQERGWTQLEFANRLGVTPATVFNWERGKYEPKASQLRAMARAFGVSMDDIDFEGGDREERTSGPVRPGR